MNAPIVILGILVGLVFAAKEITSSERKRSAQRSPSQPRGILQPTPPQLPSIPQQISPPSLRFRRLDDLVADMRRGVSDPLSYPQVGNETLNGRNILENWRKSVLGLIRLAESNLRLAKNQTAVTNYRGAVEAAATSVENISRALLHCYGEKPDISSGQEEPLRLLVRRFQGEERARFEKAIDDTVQVYRNKIVEAYISEKSIQAQLLDESRTQQVVETATKIVSDFRRIMGRHFGAEIVELSEKCPRCDALNIGVWAFDIRGATYQCNACGYKWIQSTQ